MNLFIIGNGFDMGHDMSTTYLDFREYLAENHYWFLESLIDPYRISPLTIPHTNNDDSSYKAFWKDFESNLSKLDDEYFVDMENERTLNLEGGDIYIEDTMDDYHSNNFGHIKDLKVYLKEWITSIDVTDEIKTTLIDEENKDLYMSFNYTSTLQKNYGINNRNILHIHGSMEEDDELEIGHGDSSISRMMRERAQIASEKFNEKESSISNALANYYDDSRKNTPRIINFRPGPFINKLNMVNQVYVIGHSFGEVDLQYFIDINKMIKNNAEWVVFYFNDDEKNIFKEKMIRIVGNGSNKFKLVHSDSFYNM